MKKIFFVLLAFLPLFINAQERHIVVIADPHVLAPELMDTASNSFREMIDGQRKMIQWSAEAFDAVLDTCKRYKNTSDIGLDAVLIVGDLTKDGEKESHNYVRNALNDLLLEGIQVYVIPGNHDIGGKAYKYVGDEKEEVETIDRDDWNEYFYTIMAPSSNNKIQWAMGLSNSFSVEPFEGVTLIGIDGSDDDASIGYLNENDLGFVRYELEEARKKGNMVIAMSHWQVLEHFDKQGSLESSCRFENADEVRDLLMSEGVHLLLTGHFHVNGITTYKDSTDVIPDSLVEITTGSPITYPLPFRYLTISEDRTNVRVETRYLQEPIAGHEDVQAYSREWMREHTENLIPQMALRLWNKFSDRALQKAADTFGESAAAILQMCIPEDDSTKVALVEKHMGSTIVDLYLFHSEANENERPELGDSLAQALYDGMETMIDEVMDVDSKILKVALAEFKPVIVEMAKAYAREPVQSIVEDVTMWASPTYSDRTDDLHPILHINEIIPGSEGIENVEQGSLDSTFYDVLGRPVSEPTPNGVYIQGGKKIMR